MIEVIHVSDLHFGKRTRAARELLGKLESRFKFRDSANRYLMITGDIVQDGTKRQMETAAEALSVFNGKVFLAPGNHDYGFLGFLYSAGCARCFDTTLALGLGMGQRFFEKFPVVHPLDDGNDTRVLLIGLNSCAQTALPFDIASGVIGPKQRDRLAKLLDRPQYEGVPRIVYLHHIPHRRAQGIGMSLTDSGPLMEIVRDSIDTLAFGHEGLMEEIEDTPPAKLRISKAEKKELMAIGRRARPGRVMKLRSGKGQGIRYYLDANRSVDDSACYQITVSGGDVAARRLRLD